MAEAQVQGNEPVVLLGTTLPDLEAAPLQSAHDERRRAVAFYKVMLVMQTDLEKAQAQLAGVAPPPLPGVRVETVRAGDGLPNEEVLVLDVAGHSRKKLVVRPGFSVCGDVADGISFAHVDDPKDPSIRSQDGSWLVSWASFKSAVAEIHRRVTARGLAHHTPEDMWARFDARLASWSTQLPPKAGS